ncbi:uncharacterized protein [Aristolochia californica]|uniref:uncharacterized protein n=1 Tax=Aristolochia californica TaxID=171875 RepID=UPI0035E28CB1
MDESASSLPTSHLLGSVPAVISDERKTTPYEVPESNLQIFPPASGGYHSPGSSNAYVGGEDQGTFSWKGVFSISSYKPYFNVDTDVVLDRIKSSLYPLNASFFSKIDENPDLYGPLWISTTLIFMFTALGNCATYFMDKRTDKSTTWTFDVSKINVAAGVSYGYVGAVPVAYYFLLQYLGSNASLIRLWCMWGYSMFIFVIASILLLIPVEFVRWIIILLAGCASACFVAVNLKSYIVGAEMLVIVSALVLQFALAIFLKAYFFP